MGQRGGVPGSGDLLAPALGTWSTTNCAMGKKKGLVSEPTSTSTGTELRAKRGFGTAGRRLGSEGLLKGAEQVGDVATGGREVVGVLRSLHLLLGEGPSRRTRALPLAACPPAASSLVRARVAPSAACS